MARGTTYALLLATQALLPLPAAARQSAEIPATMSLMAVPDDGIAYRDARLRARELLAQQDYSAAEPIVERLVREYPRDGLNWMLLGQAKAGLDQHAEAGAAFEQAAERLGWNHPLHLLAYHAIANHMQAEDRDHALELLRRAIFEHRNFYLRSRVYDLSVFAALRDDPEFLALAGRAARPASTRAQRWEQDIDYLVDEVRRVNPDYHDAPFPEEFERRRAALRASAGTLSDEEIFVGMNHMLAALRQEHLGVFPPSGNRHLPVQFYAFPEGVYIVGADSLHASIVGSRVIAIGATPMAEVLRRLADVRSAGSDMQHLWGVSDLSSAYHLKGTRIIDTIERADVTLDRGDGRTETIRIATAARAPSRRLDKLVAPPGTEPPLFLRRADEAHWETPLPAYDALYVQVNQVRPDPDESMPQFGRRLMDVMNQVRPTNLILDLRHNNGGDTSTYTELLRTVVAFGRDSANRVYVLIGRRVFSATANLVTDLERLADPVFVGEATSSCCNFTGDPSIAILPNSGIVGELTSVRWNLSYNQFDTRKEMQPHVPVQLTAAAYFAGEDPALDAVFRMIDDARRRR